MVSAIPTWSTYEEAPEQLRDLIKSPSSEKGAKPSSRSSKNALLSAHNSNLVLLSKGNVPVKNFILPEPYPPSRIAITNGTETQITNLLIDQRDPESYLIAKTITEPYMYSSSITIIEDSNGDVARLTVGNLEDTVLDPILPEGTILAIKQPCWHRQLDGGIHIRVDHPSDLVIMKSDDKIVPEKWRRPEEFEDKMNAAKYKKQGDMMFLKKKFRKALEYYRRGLIELESKPNPASTIDFYRKKCGVEIVLLRLDDAAHDLALAIQTHASSTPDLSETPINDLATIKSWLYNGSTEDPLKIATKIPRSLKELAARIKFDLGLYQKTPEYNLPLISSYVGPLTLHVDAAHYVSDTEIRKTATHGRGLFAKRAFKTGELICAEKAFVLPGYFIQDRSSDCLLYNLGDGTASPRPGALLFRELVQKLSWNPSLRKEVFELDDGGYWKQHGWEVTDGEDVPVDVFRIEKIRQLNCFSVPTRSLDLLSQPPGTNPELRNGFWVHASYVNHSCLPNSVRTFIGDIHFLRATRDISAGEEVTHQYVSPEIDIIERQEKYEGTWGFKCDCHLCEVDGTVSEEKRKERLRKFAELKALVMKLGERGTTITSIKKIARGLREIEGLYSPLEGQEGEDEYNGLPRLALVHPSLFLTEAWRGVKNVDKTIEFARKLLRNFGIVTSVEHDKFQVVSNSGMVNVEAVRALKYLSEGYASKGETKLAEQCLETARTWFVVITGSEVGADEFFKV